MVTEGAGVHDEHPLSLGGLVVLECHPRHELRLPTQVDVVRPERCMYETVDRADRSREGIVQQYRTKIGYSGISPTRA